MRLFQSVPWDLTAYLMRIRECEQVICATFNTIAFLETEQILSEY